VPPPEDGSDPGPHARNLLLRALIREGYVKGKLRDTLSVPYRSSRFNSCTGNSALGQ
jgi:hypothetical protein